MERRIQVTPKHGLVATPVFDTYWRFAAERQNVFARRLRGDPPPWTTDPIIRDHRFTNVYRASDRVSQYLIRHVIYEGDQDPKEVVFRTLLFKLFNKIETWRVLTTDMDVISWALRFVPDNIARALGGAGVIYSAAYIMPSPDFGHARKHRNGH